MELLGSTLFTSITLSCMYIYMPHDVAYALACAEVHVQTSTEQHVANVHRGSVHSGPKLETTQMSINSQLDNYNTVQARDRIPHSNENEPHKPQRAATWINMSMMMKDTS